MSVPVNSDQCVRCRTQLRAFFTSAIAEQHCQRRQRQGPAFEGASTSSKRGGCVNITKPSNEEHHKSNDSDRFLMPPPPQPPPLISFSQTVRGHRGSTRSQSVRGRGRSSFRKTILATSKDAQRDEDIEMPSVEKSPRQFVRFGGLSAHYIGSSDDEEWD